MTNCAYMYGRECNSDCKAYNPYAKPYACYRLNNDEKIAHSLEILVGKYTTNLDITDIVGVHKTLEKVFGE